MLNLSRVFEDAARALAGHSDRLAIGPLPAVVYLMQVDVINHYRLALDHYLTVSLDAPFLQNSSLGSPYQKWAYVTNEDFEELSFAARNLLRYTSRLLHESELLALRDDRRYSDYVTVGNFYTTLICEFRDRANAIGVYIHPDSRLSVMAARTVWSNERVICRRTATGLIGNFRIVSDADGTEREEPIGEDEYERITEAIQTESIDIADRAQLLAVRKRGYAEIAQLRERNHAFRQECERFYQSRPIVAPFENLNASYWI